MKKYLVLLWFVFLAMTLFLDFAGKMALLSSVCKFMIVSACMIIAVFFGTDIKLKAAMIFTVAADFFIILTPFYIIGVFLFCVAQNIYIQRHTADVKLLALNILFLPAAIAAFYLTGNLLVGVSAFYGCCLLTSCFSSLKVWKIAPLATIGMTLFLMCDIFVLLYNFDMVLAQFDYLNRNNGNFIVLFIWLFYAPSQLLLAFSSIKTT